MSSARPSSPVVPSRSRLPLALVVLTLLLGASVLSGCIGEQVPPDTPELPLLLDEDTPPVYTYAYEGDLVAVPGYPIGGAIRVHNVWDAPVSFDVRADLGHFTDYEVLFTNLATTYDTSHRKTGDVGADAQHLFGDWEVATLEPGGDALFIWSFVVDEAFNGTEFVLEMTTSVHPVTLDANGTHEHDTSAAASIAALHEHQLLRTYAVETGNAAVRVGDHVQTATVGLWLNGTSFYTNIQDLHDDPDFPAGYDPAEFDAAPLPVYVYDTEGSEQPMGSMDTCHFTTIRGYNELLKTQAEHTTNVRYLMPREGYTVEGAEGHSLYGDALVFINTIVKHDGGTSTEDEAPQPTGECFDPTRYGRKSPVPISVPRPVS